MYSCLIVGTKVTALVKGEEAYQYFTYSGKPMQLPYRGKTVTLENGQRFGVRKSANKKDIRMVLGDDITRVITLSLSDAKKIAKNIEEA